MWRHGWDSGGPLVGERGMGSAEDLRGGNGAAESLFPRRMCISWAVVRGEDREDAEGGRRGSKERFGRDILFQIERPQAIGGGTTVEGVPRTDETEGSALSTPGKWTLHLQSLQMFPEDRPGGRRQVVAARALSITCSVRAGSGEVSRSARRQQSPSWTWW